MLYAFIVPSMHLDYVSFCLLNVWLKSNWNICETKFGVKFSLLRLVSRNGQKAKTAALHANRSCIQSSVFVIGLHLSSCQSEMSHSVRLAADKRVNVNWESFTVQFQTLIAFQVVACCVVNTSSLFFLSLTFDTALIRSCIKLLTILTFIWDAFWCRVNPPYGKSDTINPVYSCYSFRCFQGMGVPMCCLRSKCLCDWDASLCECHCDCHSFSFSLTWMNGQRCYHGSESHDSHWCSEQKTDMMLHGRSVQHSHFDLTMWYIACFCLKSLSLHVRLHYAPQVL